MYSMNTRTAENAYNDSKYTVADILSSMANGEPVTPTFSAGYMNNVVSGATPTSLMTPTSLANLEQTFIELQSVPPVSVGRGMTQSGFVPPVVDPIKTNTMDYDSSDSDWSPESSPAAKRSRLSNGNRGVEVSSSTPIGKGGRRSKYEKLSPEEDERRRVRRERNKVAAAKCRQRRVDHTNKLVDETTKLEDERSSLENEIQSLQQQKEQLEFLLQAHKPLCHMNKSKEPMRSVIVKQEPGIEPAHAKHRPNSLPLSQANNMSTSASKASAISEALGIPITTPSSGVFTLTLDSIVDHTGLTPIAGPSCASQVQRSGSDSSPDNVASPTKLMAL